MVPQPPIAIGKNSISISNAFRELWNVRMPGGGRRRGSREAVGDEPAVVVVAPARRKDLPPSLFKYNAVNEDN